eukprot:symbB.v1.2.032165.t1/scaffold3822.1/size49698/5
MQNQTPEDVNVSFLYSGQGCMAHGTLENLRRFTSNRDFNLFLKTCSGSSSWQQASFALNLALNKKFLDVISYNSVLAACAKASCWKQAVAIFHDLLEDPSLQADARHWHQIYCGTFHRMRSGEAKNP